MAIGVFSIDARKCGQCDDYIYGQTRIYWRLVDSFRDFLVLWLSLCVDDDV